MTSPPIPSTAPSKSGETPSVTTLIDRTIDHARDLARAEIALARTEFRAELQAFKWAALVLIATAMLAQIGLGLVAFAVIVALGSGGGAILGVAVGTLIVAGLTLFVGQRILTRDHMKRTKKTLGEDARTLTESARTREHH